MDKNQIEAIGHLIKGTVKENLGKIIGDAKFTADGSNERASGQTQCAAVGENLVGMDADRIKGIGHQLKGALKEGLGNITGDPELQADGVAEREAGKAQNAVGSARDTARDAIRAEQKTIDRISETAAAGAGPKPPEQSD